MDRKMHGIERVTEYLTKKIYDYMHEYNYLENVPSVYYYLVNDALDQCSIGQLLTLATLGNRWKGLKIHNYDGDTLYLTIVGLYGGMDKDGYINT